MAYTTINKSSDHFNTKLYTGTGSTNAQTGLGFQPDWVWMKVRSTTGAHRLCDAVRGATKLLQSNATDAEQTGADTLTSFDSDGFTLGADAAPYNVNVNGQTMAAWCWKAGNSSGSSNSDGSITSTVSVNTTSGFSIVKYTGNESGAPKTVGHGLGVAPKMIIIKRLNDSINWGVYHESLGNTKVISLNTTDASTTSSAYWNDTTPTSSVFTINGNHTVNHTGSDFIAYCFAEKKGFSKFGSYTGNGNADGTFIYTGFKPAWFMWKRSSSSGGWYISDSKRDTFNEVDVVLSANDNGSESDQGTTFDHDFLSNGIKIRNSVAAANSSNETFIYMAFAEAPLVGSNNVPSTAR